MHQLDLTRSRAHESRLQALALAGGAMDQLAAESSPVKLDRLVEVGDRHSDVSDKDSDPRHQSIEILELGGVGPDVGLDQATQHRSEGARLLIRVGDQLSLRVGL